MDLAVGLLGIVARIGDDVDHAGGCGVTVEDGLGSVEDLDPADAAQGDAGVVRCVEVEAVQVFAVHGHEDASESILPVSAHLDLREGGIARAEMVDVESGDVRGEFGQVLRV